MKLMLLTAFILASSTIQPAFAKVKSDYILIQTLSYDGSVLSGQYMTGGGCQVHTPELELKLVDQHDEDIYAKKLYKVVVSIADTSPEFDGCEAGILVDYSFNLQEEIKKQLRAQGQSIRTINVSGIILPEISN